MGILQTYKVNEISFELYLVIMSQRNCSRCRINSTLHRFFFSQFSIKDFEKECWFFLQINFFFKTSVQKIELIFIYFFFKIVICFITSHNGTGHFVFNSNFCSSNWRKVGQRYRTCSAMSCKNWRQHRHTSPSFNLEQSLKWDTISFIFLHLLLSQPLKKISRFVSWYIFKIPKDNFRFFLPAI